MPKKMKDDSRGSRGSVEVFVEYLIERVAAALERSLAAALGPPRLIAKKTVDRRRSGRICPAPGCRALGAGPRNRWFCRDHAKGLSVGSQKAAVERPAEPPAKSETTERVVRLPPKAPRPLMPLNMSCRVLGCERRSRGPRAGFICDQHRAELSPEEQQLAREAYRTARLHRDAPSAANRVVLPVPPIVRKAVETPLAAVPRLEPQELVSAPG